MSLVRIQFRHVFLNVKFLCWRTKQNKRHKNSYLSTSTWFTSDVVSIWKNDNSSNATSMAKKKTKTKDNCDWPKWDTVLNPVGLYLLLCFVVVVVVGWLFGRCACRISSCFISWHEFDAVEITIIIVVVTYEWLTRALFRVPAPNLTHCRHSCPLDLSLSLSPFFILFVLRARARSSFFGFVQTLKDTYLAIKWLQHNA